MTKLEAFEWPQSGIVMNQHLELCIDYPVPEIMPLVMGLDQSTEFI